jgi:hypothetical protein
MATMPANSFFIVFKKLTVWNLFAVFLKTLHKFRGLPGSGREARKGVLILGAKGIVQNCYQFVGDITAGGMFILAVGAKGKRIAGVCISAFVSILAG